MVITAPLPNLATPEFAALILLAVLMVVLSSNPKVTAMMTPDVYVNHNPSEVVPVSRASITEPVPIVGTRSLDTPLDHDGPEGNVHLASEEPVLEGERPSDQIDVFVNFRIARQPDGHHAIRVFLPETGVVTAAQAHWLHIDLDAASQAVSSVRTALGYES